MSSYSEMRKDTVHSYIGSVLISSEQEFLLVTDDLPWTKQLVQLY